MNTSRSRPRGPPTAGNPYSGTTTHSAAASTAPAPRYSPVRTEPPSGPTPPYGAGGPGSGGRDNKGGGGTAGPRPQESSHRRTEGPPRRSRRPRRRNRRRSALMVGGGLKALDVANIIDLGDSANAIAWASAAAVLGLGSSSWASVADLRHPGFFAVAALITGGIFNVVGNGERVRFQQVDWTPASIQQASEGLTSRRAAEPLTSPGSPGRPACVRRRGSPGLHRQQRHGGHPRLRARGHPGRHDPGQPQGRREPARRHTTRESSYNTDKPGSHLVIEIDGTVSNVTIQEGN